jgi:chitodextrinase
VSPTTPSGAFVTTRTKTSLGLAWSASTDNVGVAGYGVYRNSTRVATSPVNSHTLTGLACGSYHYVGVDAYDAAGNRSGRISFFARTASC